MDTPLPPQLIETPILITGASGLVGSAIVRLFKSLGASALLTPRSSELNLLEAGSVDDYFRKHRPRVVLMIAARVGGIKANASMPVEFTQDNLTMQTNLFTACHRAGTLVNVFMGSSCIYPRMCPQPMKETDLQTGPLEPTNEGYALSKLVGLRLADFYLKQYGMRTICPLPCNIYGPNDHFDFERAHVLSSLVRRFVDAVDQKIDHVTLWGTGTPRRELIHSDDVARAVLFLLDRHFSPAGPMNADPVNVGTGVDHSILQIAQIVGQATGFTGQIRWDTKMPDGMPRKCLDVSRISQWGFRAQVPLEQGVAGMVREYKSIKSRQEKA